jgi:hypothetical protein
MKPIGHKPDELPGLAAKQVINGFVGALKKLNLYSGSHTVYQNSLNILKNILDDHFARFGNFRIRIERRNILVQDEVIYEGESEPSNPAFLLHRDGILWLEFQSGIELWEIDTFFKILHDHSALNEEPDDDIVTALWAVNLPSIVYEAAELEFGYQDDINIADFQCVEDQTGDAAEKTGEQGQFETLYSTLATNVLLQDARDELWQLTDGEREQLRIMIAAEEKLDGSDYVIDALLYILENHCLEEDIAELLDTLHQELREALVNARFTYLLETVVRLKKDILNVFPPSHWMVPHLRRFFMRLTGKPFLDGLLRIPAHLQHFKATQLKELKRFLLLLDRAAVTTLGPMLLNTGSAKLQRVLMETIGTMAMSDFHPLERLIADSEPVLAGRLVFLLSFLKDSRSRKVLSNLLRHPSELVRRPALKAILTRDDQAIDEILALIDDSDDKIRTLVLNRLGRKRCEHAENRLLDYLDAHACGIDNGEHFIRVCHALGRCGSERSIPYLTKLLFKWPPLGVLRSYSSPMRKGAVVALKALNTKRAAWLMDRNGRGFLANVFRSAITYSD